MDDLLLESAVEGLAYLVYALGAGGATAAGLFAERTGVQTLSAGELGLGLWYMYMGAAALYIGVYLLGHQRLLPLVRDAGA